MHELRLSIFAAVTAFILGLLLGHYISRSPKPLVLTNPQPAAVERPTLPSLTTAEANPTAAPSESSEKSPPASTENLIADLKAALSRPGSQRSYAAISKI